MDFRIRPKSDYLHHASWQQLYALTKHWQSDLQFYADEVVFFRNLAGNKLIWLEKDQNIEAIRIIGNRLTKAASTIAKLDGQFQKHLQHLGEFTKHPNTQGAETFRLEHSTLEDQFTEFVKSIRDLKKEIFDLVEEVTEGERNS